ncbi:MAG: tetratricopeptide repeat protein [Rikenellaceae bacterium]
MANKNVNTPEEEALNEAMTKTEIFFAENGRKVVYGLLGLIAVAALLFGYKMLVMEPRMQAAAELISSAQMNFDSTTPNYELALMGDGNSAGFLDVIADYGSTPSANLAYHYAGICYLQMGDVASAGEYLAKYKSVKGIPGELINAQNLGLQGDVAVEKGDYKGAIAFYAKAVEASENDFTAPLYLRKGALAFIALGDKAAAKALLERIVKGYPSSQEVMEANKMLGTI